MKTLAQRRAAVALRWKDEDFGGKQEGNVISGFPMLIRADGLLPALAYAVEKKSNGDDYKNRGEFQIASSLVEHLSNEGILTESKSPMDMVA
jgi:CRISPR/Cas system CMR-associated protein Cmr5 small subunit